MHNILPGNIPLFFPMMDSLRFLEIENNNFSGCIPHEILNTCQIINYNFDDNPLLTFMGDMDLA